MVKVDSTEGTGGGKGKLFNLFFFVDASHGVDLEANPGSKRPREDLKTRGFRRYEAPEGQVLAGEGLI